jgi:hypothetical protein
LGSIRSQTGIKKPAFLAGVFLICFSVLVLQIVQTRILSVISWYYLAFFAISVAMLGMTIGAVWVYVQRERFHPDRLASDLSFYALATAISIPGSMMVQFSLITTLALNVTTLVSWCFLLAAMTVPYVFAGIVVSLALTRSPFPVNQVYGVDLLGAAAGCAAVVLLLNVLDGPTTLVVTGLTSALAAICFGMSASGEEQQQAATPSWWPRPLPVILVLLALGVVNTVTPIGLRPILVKDHLERFSLNVFEQWNSYSRIFATRPSTELPFLWGPSPNMPADLRVQQASLDIDGFAGTEMYHYDGTRESIEFLRYDVVNLAYNLPGIRKAAIIGVGGGRDLLSAHLYGVRDITGVELNPIFISLHTKHPYYKAYSNLTALPNLKLHVDDARSWFANTNEKFDLVQMSMIDTFAATGAGSYSLSENGLYTLEGWRAFINTLNGNGVFTVSRWFNPDDVKETGRMIGLATATLLDMGVSDARPHLFVARANRIATLVLSKSPFTDEQLLVLKNEVQRLGFNVLLAPDQPSETAILAGMVASQDIDSLNVVASSALLDLTVPTDNRPFFFNQLRFTNIPEVVMDLAAGGTVAGGIKGNLMATATLLIILFISIVAVVITIILPLRSAANNSTGALIAAGSAYFSLIGMGFMFAEISLLQYFSVYLGHPIYSLSVCLFSLILATGLGSLASGRINIASPREMVVWGLLVAVYLLCLQQWLTDIFHATTARELPVRILISLAVVVPLGFLLGFAFPTGMKLVGAIDKEPMPWFWGINGATGVLASVLAVMLSIGMGISATMLVASLCYVALIPISFSLMRQRADAGRESATAQPSFRA